MSRLQPDIIDVLFDETVGGNQSFAIERTAFGVVNGRARAVKSTEAIPAVGSVQPLGDDALMLLPEGERGSERIVVRTTTPILDGGREQGADTMADVILYRGKRYKVESTKDWSAWGMCKAVCVRINERSKKQTGGDSS